MIEHWSDNSFADVLRQKTLYANCGDKFYKYKVVSNCIVRTEEIQLYSDHEEADSRMFFHVASLAENYSSDNPVNVVVRSTDTDSLVIAIGCFQKWLQKNQNLKLLFEMGVEMV